MIKIGCLEYLSIKTNTTIRATYIYDLLYMTDILFVCVDAFAILKAFFEEEEGNFQKMIVKQPENTLMIDDVYQDVNCINLYGLYKHWHCDYLFSIQIFDIKLFDFLTCT